MLVSQATDNNPLPSLGESVSFGRFISDSSLAWEKWSSFSSHNRYVEEAERYAQPGSVAQKKAFFEAHYKRIAAQKAAAAAAAAAQLDHTNNAPEPEPVESHVNKDTQILHLLDYKAEEEFHEQSPVLPAKTECDLIVAEREASPIRDIEPLDQIGDKNGNKEQIEDSPTVSFEEKPLLQHKTERNHVSSSSTSTKSSASLRAAKVFSSPAKPAAVTPSRRKENNNKNNVTPLIIKKSETTERRRWSPRSSFHSKVFQYSSISSTPKPEPDNNKTKPNTPATAAHKIESSKVVPTSAKAASNKVFKTPTRNYWTTPSKMASSSKTAGTKHHPPATTATTTPCSENSRSRTPAAPSVSGSKTSGPKWHLLSSVCSKSLSACKNKLQSPTLAVPFSLRTEERATIRKQNLEEKFNSKDAEKLQLQTRIKEKAETEFRKFRENFCFKARPLPDFYKDKEIIKKTMIESNKVLLPPQSPKLMGTRTGCMNMKKKKNQEKEDEVQVEARTTSVPPPRKMLPFSSTKTAAASTRKGGWGHNRQIPTTSSRIICQNISPNIILQKHR